MVKIYSWQSIALCNWLCNVPGFCALLKSKWPAMPSGHKSNVPLVSIKAHLQGNNHMQLIPTTVILRLPKPISDHPRVYIKLSGVFFNVPSVIIVRKSAGE
jgi:hypothetical protein